MTTEHRFAHGRIGRRVSPSSRPRRRLDRESVFLRVELAAELRRLGPALVTGFLHDRGDLRVGDEALPTLCIPVEENPDTVRLVGVAEDGRKLGSVLLPLLGALVEKTFSKRSESSTCLVARIIVLLISVLGFDARCRWCGSVRSEGPGPASGERPMRLLGHDLAALRSPQSSTRRVRGDRLVRQHGARTAENVSRPRRSSGQELPQRPGKGLKG